MVGDDTFHQSPMDMVPEWPQFDAHYSTLSGGRLATDVFYTLNGVRCYSRLTGHEPPSAIQNQLERCRIQVRKDQMNGKYPPQV